MAHPDGPRDVLKIWLPLLLIAALGVAWYHVLRLREHATDQARRLCERHRLQFLDDSVALHRLRVYWRNGSLHVLRDYRFDTSHGGNDRHTASITLLRDRIVQTSLPSAPPADAAVPVATSPFVSSSLPRPEPESGNVIPLDRRRRTLH